MPQHIPVLWNINPPAINSSIKMDGMHSYIGKVLYIGILGTRNWRKKLKKHAKLAKHENIVNP